MPSKQSYTPPSDEDLDAWAQSEDPRLLHAVREIRRLRGWFDHATQYQLPSGRYVRRQGLRSDRHWQAFNISDFVVGDPGTLAQAWRVAASLPESAEGVPGDDDSWNHPLAPRPSIFED